MRSVPVVKTLNFTRPFFSCVSRSRSWSAQLLVRFAPLLGGTEIEAGSRRLAETRESQALLVFCMHIPMCEISMRHSVFARLVFEGVDSRFCFRFGDRTQNLAELLFFPGPASAGSVRPRLFRGPGSLRSLRRFCASVYRMRNFKARFRNTNKRIASLQGILAGRPV